jgi:hypothetical protein
MSLIRKVSLDYRMARAARRIKQAEANAKAQQEQLQEALRLGMLKIPQMRMPASARVVIPREELKKRIGEGALRATGRRVGRKPYELQTYARKPDRNKYAGMFSPGTWG